MYYNINRAQTQVFLIIISSIYFYAIHRLFYAIRRLFYATRRLFYAIRRFFYAINGRFTETCRASYEGLSLRLRKSAAANDIKKRGYKSISRVFCLSFYLFGMNRFRFICPLSWRASRSESQAPRRPRPQTPLSTFRKPREVRKRKEQARRI